MIDTGIITCTNDRATSDNVENPPAASEESGFIFNKLFELKLEQNPYKTATRLTNLAKMTGIMEYPNITQSLDANYEAGASSIFVSHFGKSILFTKYIGSTASNISNEYISTLAILDIVSYG